MNAEVVERVATSKGSRLGVIRALLSAAGIQASPLRDIPPEVLASPPYAAYTAPLSTLVVQQKRPYFLGREWTDGDLGYAGFYVAMHAAALLLGPLTYSPEALQVAVGGYVLTGCLGICLSYHRQLTHKSFRCPKPLEYFFAYCGALAFEGDPVEWSKMHRWHHMHSDTLADRHSPKDGIWHSHMGWLFDQSLANTRRDPKSGSSKDDLAPPWFYQESPEFYGWLRRTYMGHMAGQALFFLAWGGLPYFVWGFVIRVLFTMHVTWLVNSAVHVWGAQPYATGDESRNNAAVSLFAFGEGWHNNHHAFEWSARHGLEWWQLDVTYGIIRALELAGLAWDVRVPSEQQKAQKRRRRDDEP